MLDDLNGFPVKEYSYKGEIMRNQDVSSYEIFIHCVTERKY